MNPQVRSVTLITGSLYVVGASRYAFAVVCPLAQAASVT
jgi:hypothetical protein